MNKQPETRDESIGSRVREMRGELSQQDLADRMRECGWKWSQATVWSVESGARALRLAEASDLADILDGAVSDLLTPPSLARALRAHREQRQRLARLGEAVVAAMGGHEALLHVDLADGQQTRE